MSNRTIPIALHSGHHVIPDVSPFETKVRFALITVPRLSTAHGDQHFQGIFPLGVNEIRR